MNGLGTVSKPASETTSPARERDFSWERWIFEGLRAAKQVLFRYDFGMPEDFWYHMERAAHELLTAMRILLRTLRSRRFASRVPEEERGTIDIDWS